jgi:hypothetical protein
MLVRKNNFAVVPQSLLSDPHISLSAKGLYGVLQTFQSNTEPSIELIANYFKVFPSDIEKWMEELIESSYVFIVMGDDDKITYVIR